jgi:C4-dicarboxylate-specific signal transduction histidine kinase
MLATLLSIGGRPASVLFFLNTVQMLYGLLLGRRLNREFWQAVVTNETLERRTEALDQQSRGLERANTALTAEIAARERVEVELRLAQKLEAVAQNAAKIQGEAAVQLIEGAQVPPPGPNGEGTHIDTYA